MEWERAKNYILLFFILLNLGLAFMWFAEYNRYTMTADQERMIHAILGQNNISMYTRPMRRSPPMRTLNVSAFYYDVDALMYLFFDDLDAVNRMGEDYVFEDAESRLVVVNGFVSYENFSEHGFRDTALAIPRGIGENGITRIIASNLADTFIAKYFPTFHQDSIFYTQPGLGVRVIYRQSYRGRLIHSNFIEFLITANGIRQIEMQFGRVLGHGGTSQMIFAPDEALLTFVQRIRHDATYTPMVITHMDLVYFQEYFGSDQPGTFYPAVPVYRIFIQGEAMPFLINAYRNVMID